MSVTVIVTVYNKLQHIRNSIMSLNAQSVQPDELILADDGSSEDIASGIADLIPECRYRIRHVWQTDQGFRAAKNRNNGARAAQGDYLVFFDQDLVFTHRYLELILETRKKGHFFVGFPVWLTQEQTNSLTPDIIRSCEFDRITTPEQLQFQIRQYRKERLYTFLNRFGLRKKGPSLRSGNFGLFKNDFIRVNGFDETYQEWGYEDDDLGIRFYASGIKGYNPLRTEFALHCHHPFANRASDGNSLNRDYFKCQEKVISAHHYRCEYGYDNPLGGGDVIVRELN
jgi:glycosyltransferase involved in cell wall biosynthesis